MIPPIIPVLFKFSREKEDTDRMLTEWIILNREDLGSACAECPCGQQNIREICNIRNVLTKEQFFIGNECVLHLKGDGIGLCSVCKIYRCVSHTALMCDACGKHKKTAPKGYITKGKWKGRAYDDPILKNYANWVMDNQGVMGIDKNYIAYLLLKREQRVAEARAVAERRRLALAENGS
jgi:hypothetical protein